MSVCRSEELQASELSLRLQTPTLIGCVFLMNRHKTLTSCSSLAVISWALYSSTLFKPQSNKLRFKFIPLQTQKPPIRSNRGLRVDWSLTMTYFHTGIRTIIGAKAFHCPVRDGKEWYHLAMVIRHNLLLLLNTEFNNNEFIESGLSVYSWLRTTWHCSLND